MYAQTKNEMLSTLRYIFWDTEKDSVTEIDRTNELTEHFLEDFKVDPTSATTMYIAVTSHNSFGVMKANLSDGRVQKSSYVSETNFVPMFIKINESCTQYNVSHNSQSDDGMKSNNRIKIIGINESPKVKLEDPDKDFSLINSNSICKVNDNNFVYYYNNDRNQP